MQRGVRVAVSHLLRLHDLERRGVLGRPSKGIEAVVAGDAVSVEDNLSAQTLGDEDRDGQLVEDRRRQLVLRLERVEGDVRSPRDGQLR